MVQDGFFTLERFLPHFPGYLIGIVSVVVSCFVVGQVLRGVQRWRSLGSALRIGSGLTALLVVLAQVTVDPLAAGANTGIARLTERILIIEVLGWFVAFAVLSLRARTVAVERSSQIAA